MPCSSYKILCKLQVYQRQLQRPLIENSDPQTTEYFVSDQKFNTVSDSTFKNPIQVNPCSFELNNV